MHDLHHVVDEAGVERRRLLTARVLSRTLSHLYWRTCLDHRVDNGGERLNAHMFVTGLGQVDGTRERQFDFVDECVLRVQTVVAGGECHDEEATQRRAVLVAKGLIGGEKVVEEKGERVAVLGDVRRCDEVRDGRGVLLLFDGRVNVCLMSKVGCFVDVLRDYFGAASI